jgi:hypothetical protein
VDAKGNRFLLLTLLFVGVGTLWPFVTLRGGLPYSSFVVKNLKLFLAVAASWGVVFYWTARRIYATFLIRGAGERLRAREEVVR